MPFVKCPRCELNYMLDTDDMCSVCRREVRGESDQDDMIELCSECGENPVVPGSELCAYCLKEMQRRSTESTDDVIVPDDSAIGIDSVATMDEIDIGDGIEDAPFAADDDDFDDSEDDEEEKSEEDDDDDEDDED